MTFQDDAIKRLNPNNCPSSHGGSGFMYGTVYDPSTGTYSCPCGRQYFSSLSKPDTIEEKRTYLVTQPNPINTRRPSDILNVNQENQYGRTTDTGTTSGESQRP